MGTRTDEGRRAGLPSEPASLSLLESRFQHRHLQEWIRSHVRCEPDCSALDVGDHEGELACVLAPAVRQLVIVDPDPTALAAAERRVDAAGLGNVVFEQSDASALPYPDESFDLVVGGLPIPRLGDPQVHVSEMARVCRQGGTIALIGAALPERAPAGPEPSEALSATVPSAPPVGRLVALLERAGTTVVHRSEHDESPEVAARLKRIGTARAFAERMRLHFTLHWTAVVAEKRSEELPPAGLA
jgi:ubiquinone/menaquinone biosynthesis C-methylase UbiE